PYFVSAANQINIKTIAFTNSKTGVLGGEYTGSFNSSLYNQEAYVRSFYDVPSRFSARFYYDGLGRLVVSQNARQYNNADLTGRKYSYTLYDALGRVVEAGEKTDPSTGSGSRFKSIFGATVSGYYNPNVIDQTKLLAWITNSSGARKEVTKSYYDATVITGLPSTFAPDVLTQRKRITHVTYEEIYDGNDQTYDHATHYDYDIHGNVKTLLQDNRKMATNFTSLASQRYKRMDYSYDLVSGNVHRMSVQNGEVDQWHHAYQYDADNRITAAYTNSQTPIIEQGQLSAALENELVYNTDWENDAKYFYYAHGPLARTEIGNDQLQGNDFIYNLQGWMKGINSIMRDIDPGYDGISNPNTVFAKDIAAFSLEYFNGDYMPINQATPFASVEETSHAGTHSSQLFNGNIRYMQTRLTDPIHLDRLPMLNAYQYDQLNRLKESRSYETGFDGSSWNPTTYGNEYYNAFSYDAMGNILTQMRHNRAGTMIEDMKYKYQYLDPTTKTKLQRNRLYHIYEPASLTSLDATDIDNMGAYDSTAVNINVTNNYMYDEEGRLVKDKAEKINKIVWRVDGKVKEIQRMTGTTKWLKFDYDAMGNRIAKHVYNNTGTTLERSTYYILDAQGNQISTYDHDVVGGTARFNLKERNIFGSSRLGSKQDSMNVLTATITQNYSQVLGTKYYEFSNHLGNVLMVYNDVKIGFDSDSDGLVDEFLVGITNSSDYSPFGVQLDGRTVSRDFYRQGFNGMEKDDEVKGSGNSYDFGARIFDARVGRWLSVDPLAEKQPNQSTYKAFLNNPLVFVDPNGKTEYETIVVYDPNGNLLFKAHRKISDNLMSGGDLDDEDGVKISGGYDYRHYTEIRMQNDGSIKVTANQRTEILKGNGIKDKEYLFAFKENGVIYNCNITSYIPFIPEGDGGTQNGGWKLTVPGGGASPTKQKALYHVKEIDVNDFLTAWGAMKVGSFGSKPVDALKNVAEIWTKFAPKIEEKDQSVEKTKNIKWIELQQMDDKSFQPIEAIISRERADEIKNAGGVYTKNKDSIISRKW
ncbi:MAG: hypothetical protein FGM14_16195, partial [Flavobacteriales bacterium]|nr:hypothetical protein [Flavobacteriales bacterium]